TCRRTSRPAAGRCRGRTRAAAETSGLGQAAVLAGTVDVVRQRPRVLGAFALHALRLRHGLRLEVGGRVRHLVLAALALVGPGYDVEASEHRPVRDRLRAVADAAA